MMQETSRARHGNALRTGVLGSTDGLVSSLSLLMGVAVSGAPRETIIVAGLAGLVAGSLSMALGSTSRCRAPVTLRQRAGDRRAPARGVAG